MKDEWQTPNLILDAVRSTLRIIDLDPASTPEANKRVKATQIYTKEQNGLEHPWTGRVFCNPPYSQTGKWVEKAKQERCILMMLLPSPRNDKWQSILEAKERLVCLPFKRLAFIDPSTGDPVIGAKGGSMIVLKVLGDDSVDDYWYIHRFKLAFAGIGHLLQTI